MNDDDTLEYFRQMEFHARYGPEPVQLARGIMWADVVADIEADERARQEAVA